MPLRRAASSCSTVEIDRVITQKTSIDSPEDRLNGSNMPNVLVKKRLVLFLDGTWNDTDDNTSV
jgi:hypothetical protein